MAELRTLRALAFTTALCVCALGLSLTAGCASDDGGGNASAAIDGGANDGGSNDGGSSDGSSSDGGSDGSSDGSNSDATAGEATFAVGVTTIEVIGAAGRKLPVEVWYPAEPTPNGVAARYGNGLAPSLYGAVRDAKPVGSNLPLVLFSHGNGGFREQSIFLTELLAHHGYVVAAPDHVGNSLWTMDNALTGAMTLWRPQDIIAVVDHLAAPATADPSWLTGLADSTRYAVMGHSFGGYTSLAIAGLKVRVPPKVNLDCEAANAPKFVCDEVAKMGPQPWDLSDARCVLAVPLAPAGYGWQMLDKILPTDVLPPIVVMGATGDTATPPATEQQPVYDDLPGKAGLLLIKGSNHYAFSDLCLIEKVLPATLKQEIGAMCNPNTAPNIETIHAVVAARALAAADLWLRQRPEAKAALTAASDSFYTFVFKGLDD